MHGSASQQSLALQHSFSLHVFFAGGYTEMKRQENEEHQRMQQEAENEKQRRQTEALEWERQRLESKDCGTNLLCPPHAAHQVLIEVTLSTVS